MKFDISIDGKDISSILGRDLSVDADAGYMLSEKGKNGTLSYTFTSNPGYSSRTNLLTIPHNYGIIPASYCMIKGISIEWIVTPASISQFGLYYGVYDNQWFDCYATATDFKIDYVYGDKYSHAYDLNMTGYNFTFKYYLFSNNG
jgi:hypothetical protein